MKLITLQEFADKHNVSIQAVRAKKFKTVKKYGKNLIDASTKYSPRACEEKGRKPKRSNKK